MNVLFLTDNFVPERNAPAARTYEHARQWVADGHSVTVITTAPNFPEGRVFPGYVNRLRHVEVIDGIRVIRVLSYISANEGFLKRTFDYLSFMVAGGLAALFERRPDVLVTTSPQFFCAMAGWFVARVRRLPWVFELRDLWPASIVAVGAMKPGLMIRWLERIELAMYRGADSIVSVTESFKIDLVSRGIAGDKIHVILNGVDPRHFRPRPRDQALITKLGLEGRFVVGYLGTIGMAHALDKVLDAAALLRDEPRIAFLIAGSGAKRAQLESRVRDEGLTNVHFLEAQPKENMPALWSIHDMALIPLQDKELFRTVIPSKMFEAMGMGIPILMSVPKGEATALLESTGAGIVVAPERPRDLADAIVGALEDPARLASLRESALAAAPQFSRQERARAMAQLLASTAGGARSPGALTSISGASK